MAEVVMILIVLLMSVIVFVWVVPAFSSSTFTDNSTAAYAEKFSTMWGNFATFAPSTPETLIDFSSDPWSRDYVCTGSITSPFSGNVYVPVNSKCLITATVGNVYVDSGGNLTVVGTTINGGLEGWNSASITLKRVNVVGWTGISNAQVITITGSSLDTSGAWICTDSCGSAMYEGGRGTFTLTNSTVNGQLESEVGHQSLITGNTVTLRLEVESTDFGQITNNKLGMLDLDQNGIVAISGNTIYGNDSYYSGSNVCAPGTATAICYGCGNGYVCGGTYGGYVYGNRWCASGNNIVVSGSHNEATCIGNVEIDVMNTGSIPVNLVAVYMSNIPLAGPISWRLSSGGAPHTSLPIIIPVGQSANVTMQWTPPKTLGYLPWTDIYFIFVSSHNNFVDGHIYFGYNPALTITSQSRPMNRLCPPCY